MVTYMELHLYYDTWNRMINIREWNQGIDLSEFYQEASNRGYVNNSTQRIMVDSLCSEDKWNVWLLEYNNKIVGATAAHSLTIFDKPSYRICARTCVLTNLLPIRTLRSLGNTITKHQNITAQYYIPKCISWCPSDSDLYITTHASTDASQRQVHQIYCPALEKSGVLTKTHELEYRGNLQTFWKLNKIEFMNQLNTMPRWNNSFINNNPTYLK